MELISSPLLLYMRHLKEMAAPIYRLRWSDRFGWPVNVPGEDYYSNRLKVFRCHGNTDRLMRSSKDDLAKALPPD